MAGAAPRRGLHFPAGTARGRAAVDLVRVPRRPLPSVAGWGGGLREEEDGGAAGRPPLPASRLGAAGGRQQRSGGRAVARRLVRGF